MNECTDVQALEKISTEVDDSQIKITLSSHCIKAQAFLVDKLRKQADRQKEVCIFISNSNVKLEAEIKQAEQEIQSLRSAYETIRSANVELRKGLLLAKENKIDIEEHVKAGEKKYEDLWLECKSRYESIPNVQKLLQSTKTAEILSDNIIALQNEAHSLVKDIDSKKTELMDLDRKRIIELANYFVNEMPLLLNTIKEKSSEINTLKREIEETAKVRKDKELIQSFVEVQKKETSSGDTNSTSVKEDTWPILCTNTEETLSMPKLQLVGTDFDVLSAKLDQIKIKKVEMLQITPIKRTDSVLQDHVSPIHKRSKKCEDNIPYYFSKPVNVEESIDNIQAKCNFSSRKLINILEDIRLDKNDTYKFVSKLNLESLKGVNAIGNEVSAREVQEAKPIESEQIEEIDLTDTNSGNVVVPPTQFLDYTQENTIRTSQTGDVAVQESVNNINVLKNSQEHLKKRVSFDLPSGVQNSQVHEKGEDDDDVETVDVETNKTTCSDLDVSGVSEEGFNKIRDMILKKHNLDLSPQFVYAKNTMTKTRTEDNMTSKFFQQTKSSMLDVQITEDPQQNEINNVEDKNEDIGIQENNDPENAVEKDENIVVSNPKTQGAPKIQKPVSGFLFKHGTQDIPDYLNVSISTTGFDDGDGDFPQCIDSSLLLSPKADLPMPMSGDNAEVLSQEVPNFLSGLRKTGLSFFGMSSATETNADTNAQNASNNFNFNFGRDDKKTRGGLFSMFR